MKKEKVIVDGKVSEKYFISTNCCGFYLLHFFGSNIYYTFTNIYDVMEELMTPLHILPFLLLFLFFIYGIRSKGRIISFIKFSPIGMNTFVRNPRITPAF